MVNASLISRLSHTVDLIEERSQQIRPLKIVTVRRSLHEDGNAAWCDGDVLDAGVSVVCALLMTR
jgi:hypothetical protein